MRVFAGWDRAARIGDYTIFRAVTREDLAGARVAVLVTVHFELPLDAAIT